MKLTRGLVDWIGGRLIREQVPFDPFYIYAVFLFSGEKVYPNVDEFIIKAKEYGYRGCYKCDTTIYTDDAYMVIDMGCYVCYECALQYRDKEW